ncbi:hypothetical protein IQ270_19725 [Microcoleus sp. LEGE 07076]|uniref:hypothetical protein n=1 Tax=Microcoleus sp. LEGE 07076 TaxID=915322 RepID=UPI0018823C37|nr:hypothetical protein [Microcoleus sp. LEGE 07076]MBE9186824.1 hypothetical protein [Microcoleus sp. LEGE 07076]
MEQASCLLLRMVQYVNLTQLRAVWRCFFWAAKAALASERGKATGKVISGQQGSLLVAIGF